MNLKEKKTIIIWLSSGLSLIIIMIIIGGITRITESGLSMVHWSLIGEFPSEDNILKSYIEWKESPQGRNLKGTNILDFKKIYFWEYIHRMLGRALGIVFIIPFAFFLIKKWIKKNEILKYLLLLLMGSGQGLLGWYMVKSGLIDIPAVSHLRLSMHLILALILASYILWLILDILPNDKKYLNHKINTLSKWFLSVLFIQITYGAFTSGLKARNLIDPNSIINTIYGYFNTPIMRNLDFINNPYNVQLLHRSIAWIILIFAVYIWRQTRRTNLRKIGNIFLSIVFIQIIIGILTLLIKNAGYIAITHQLIATTLLLITIYIIHCSQSNEKT